MIFLHLSLGTEDYDRKFLARAKLLDVTVAVGHGYYDWFHAEFSHDWAMGRDCYARAFVKAIPGEGFFEMLLRRFGPGWTR